jgi:hypothetical protein
MLAVTPKTNSDSFTTSMCAPHKGSRNWGTFRFGAHKSPRRPWLGASRDLGVPPPTPGELPHPRTPCLTLPLARLSGPTNGFASKSCFTGQLREELEMAVSTPAVTQGRSRLQFHLPSSLRLYRSCLFSSLSVYSLMVLEMECQFTTQKTGNREPKWLTIQAIQFKCMLS